MTATVYVGASAPAAVHVDISPSLSLPDLSEVTDAEIAVLDYNEIERDPRWSCTLSQQTATTLRVTHVLAEEGADLPRPERLWLIVYLTTSEGVRACDAQLRMGRSRVQQ